MKNRVKIGLLMLFVSLHTFVNGQSGVVAIGQNSFGIDGSVSYTIGQTFYIVASGVNGSQIQGVQQPFEISTVTELNDAKYINLAYSIYPNPAKDFVQLKIYNFNLFVCSELKYQLIDINGRLLCTEKLNTDVTYVKLLNNQSAVYLLNVMENNQLIKSFKITKN